MPSLSTARSRLARFRLDLLDFFFPSHCVICSSPCDGTPCCERCLGCLGRLSTPVCPRCRYFIEPSGLDCPQGHRADPSPIWSPGIFDPYFRTLIHQFKFHARRDCGEFLAGLLAEMLVADTRLDEVDAVMGVPLHPTRRRERGFDQSEIVSGIVARRLGRTWGRGWLRRLRHTPSQARLDLKRRRSNLEGAFRAQIPDPVPETVLLVDDVLTTGATLRSCAGALRDAGVSRVWGAVLALAEFGTDGVEPGDPHDR